MFELENQYGTNLNSLTTQLEKCKAENIRLKEVGLQPIDVRILIKEKKKTFPLTAEINYFLIAVKLRPTDSRARQGRSSADPDLLVELTTAEVTVVQPLTKSTLSTSCEAKYLLRLLRENNTIQLTNEPVQDTRHSVTLLNHIVGDKSDEFEGNGVIDTSNIQDYRQMQISDHKLIYCVRKFEKEKAKAKYITYRNFPKFDSQRMPPNCISGSCQMETAIDQLHSGLEGVVEWSVMNGLTLNVVKCTQQDASQYRPECGVRFMLRGRSSQSMKKSKLLDSNLMYTDHLRHNIQRALGRLKNLYRFKNLLPETAKVQLMH
ncbi:hypothetical protein J6590_067420 [Homalodisca vitripennis]|nr:hypothetical protein J6590_067420 [Homalodisca vitripennis]